MSNPSWPEGPEQQPSEQQSPPSQYPASPQTGPYIQPNWNDPSQTQTSFGQPGASSQSIPGYAGPPSQGFGQYGQAGMPSQGFGQPGAPSQGFGQYGPPSQGFGQYGQPGIPSQTLPGYAGPPSQGLYGQPGQFGPPSQGLYPMQAQPTKKRSLRWLWITLAAVVLLAVVVTGGGVIIAGQIGAPLIAAKNYCSALKTQDYTTAYNDLSSSIQSQYTQAQFSQGSQLLDQVEGPVTSCAQVAGSSTGYTFGGNTAAIHAVITRQKQGSLSGVLHLKNGSSGWKVDAIDTSLFGVNLTSLATSNTFCSALQGKDYSTAYGLLDSTAQSSVSQPNFVTQAKLRDTVDGPVTACSITAIAQGNTDTATTITVSVTRGKLGARSGSVTLALEDGQWKISNTDPNLLGRDVRPILVGNQFCTDLKAGKYNDAYKLLSSALQGGLKVSDLAPVAGSGVVYTGCSDNLSSFQQSGTTASYTTSLHVASTFTGQTASISATFSFVLEGDNWKIDDIQ